MESLERVLVGRRDLRLLAFGAQIILFDRYAKVRIRLFPNLRARPIVCLGGPEDNRQKSVVRDRAIDNLLGILVDLPADRMTIKARRREIDMQRLAARADRSLQHVIELAVELRV